MTFSRSAKQPGRIFLKSKWLSVNTIVSKFISKFKIVYMICTFYMFSVIKQKTFLKICKSLFDCQIVPQCTTSHPCDTIPPFTATGTYVSITVVTCSSSKKTHSRWGSPGEIEIYFWFSLEILKPAQTVGEKVIVRWCKIKLITRTKPGLTSIISKRIPKNIGKAISQPACRRFPFMVSSEFWLVIYKRYGQ